MNAISYKLASAGTLLALLAALALTGCSPSQDAAIAAAISKNASNIRSFCDNKVLPIATSPLTMVALTMAGSLPYGGDLTLANNSVIATCNNIDAVAQSASTLPWLQSQIPVITGAGKVAPPPVIAPAPITAATVPVS